MGNYRVNGYKVTTHPFHGRFLASSGAGSVTADTEAAAVRAIAPLIRAAKREDDERSKASAKASDDRRAKRAGKECTLTYCNSAIDTPKHRQSAQHRNAEAVERARQNGNRF